MNPTLTESGTLPVRKPSRLKYILAAILYFLFYNAASTGIALIYQFYLVLNVPADYNQEAQMAWVEEMFYQNSNLLMIVIDALLLAAVALWFVLRKKGFFAPLGLKKLPWWAPVLAAIAGIGLSVLLSLVMAGVSVVWPEIMEDYGQSMDTTYNTQNILLYVLAGVVGAPLVEELIFRRLCAGNLDKAMPRVLAILLTSVTFGIVHGHPVQMVYATVLGIVMCMIYFAYDSLWASIAFHAGFNSVSLLSLINMEQFNEAEQMLIGLGLLLFEFSFLLFGIVAFFFLIFLRPHKIFRKEKPADLPVQLYIDETIPGVAPVGEGYFTQPAPVHREIAPPTHDAADPKPEEDG